MKSKFLSQLFTDTPLTLVGLILFVFAFSALFLWVFARRGAKQHYDNLAQIALREEQAVIHE